MSEDVTRGVLKRTNADADVSCSDILMKPPDYSSSFGTGIFHEGSKNAPTTPGTMVTKDSFSSFSVSECCKYCIFLLIFTALLVIGRGDGVENFYVTQSLDSILRSNEFEKTQISQAPASYDDLMSMSDVYDYLEKVFINNILVASNTYSDSSEITAQNELNFVVLQNKLLGGFRIRQIRGKETECTHTDDRFRCYHDVWDDDDVYKGDWKGYSYQSAEELDERSGYQGILGWYHGGGHIVDFPNDGVGSNTLLSTLKTGGFFDSATRAIFIDFNTYNANLNLHSVARLSLEVPASGGVQSKSEIKTWRFNRYAGNVGKSLAALEVLFILCVIVFTMEEFYELYDKGLIGYMEDRWNILDWINLLVFYVTIGWRLHQYTLIDNDKLYDVSSYSSLRELQFSFQYENYIQMINGFLLWMKLFKYMTFSHRVRFLFTMLQRSSKDLFIFTIVLGVFYLSFGILAFLCFSSDVSDFRSFQMSVFNLIRFTVTEMDYDAVSNSNRVLGNLFYVVWSLIMIMILANVFIAILSEAYATITDEDDDDELFDRFKSSISNRIVAIKEHALSTIAGHATLQKWTSKWTKRNTADIMRDADRNQDGRLSTSEIANALNLDKEKAAQIIKQFDVDGDRKIGAEELHQLKAHLEKNKDEVKTELSKAEKDKKRRRKSLEEMHRKLDRLEALLKKATDEKSDQQTKA